MEKHNVPSTNCPEPSDARCYTRPYGQDGAEQPGNLASGVAMSHSIHTQNNKGGSLERELPARDDEPYYTKGGAL